MRRLPGSKILDFGDFGKAEWGSTFAVALAVVIIDKVVIRDHGSTWLGLSVVSFWAGVIATNTCLWLTIRRRVRLSRHLDDCT